MAGKWKRKGLPRSRPLEVRFWEKVEMGMGCWLWTGSTNQAGYGRLYPGSGHRHKLVAAHRLSWELHFGPIPVGLHILHRCDTASCVNPSHLFLGTQKDNIQDAKAKGRLSSGPSHVVHRGEAHYKAKLNDIAVADIRSRVRLGETYKRLSEEYGVCISTIASAAKGHTWKKHTA